MRNPEVVKPSDNPPVAPIALAYTEKQVTLDDGYNFMN